VSVHCTRSPGATARLYVTGRTKEKGKGREENKSFNIFEEDSIKQIQIKI
jgi:hypothetical protein